MLHSSSNRNLQSQWSRVQTRHYRDEKSHHVNAGENNIFVLCSHKESYENKSEEKQTLSGQTSSWSKKEQIHF